MPLSSPRFAPIVQCRQASTNAPPMRFTSHGAGVAAVQQALIDLGTPLPISTKRFGVPDGKFGTETLAAMKAFQGRNDLKPDGAVGQFTMAKLDALLPGVGPDNSEGLPFRVPGLRVLIAQPTTQVCWATVHCMMRSWKQQQSLDIRQAAAQVDEKYGVMVDNNKPLPSNQFGPFITQADMAFERMMNLTIRGWVQLLRSEGLLWVGTLNSIGPGAGLHSRIVEGMRGDGSVTGTIMEIMDPAGGRRYDENFDVFLAKFEGAFSSVSGDYFQIRHFR